VTARSAVQCLPHPNPHLDATVTLVGVIHNRAESTAFVRDVLRHVTDATIAVELAPEQYIEYCTPPDRYTADTVERSVMDSCAGSEFLVALNHAQAHGLPVAALDDRAIRSEAESNLTIGDLTALNAAYQEYNAVRTSTGVLAPERRHELVQTLYRRAPEYARHVLDTLDTRMSRRIATLPDDVVGVVGEGHLPGVSARLAAGLDGNGLVAVDGYLVGTDTAADAYVFGPPTAEHIRAFRQAVYDRTDTSESEQA
jgi:pheromone shutdown protein TraB